MIDLKSAVEVVDEISEIGLEVTGQTLPVGVQAGLGGINIVFETVMWDSEDGSDWTREQDIEAETPEQLRAALIGGLEDLVEHITGVLTVAKLRGGHPPD